MPLRVLIADDHELFRQGLKALLTGNGLSVEAEASNGREAVRLARSLEPDLAILDISMPELSGLETARQIARDTPATRSILLTMHSENPYVREAMLAGVNGYVLKSQAFAELSKAIAIVMSGSVYLSPGISSALRQATQKENDPNPEPLSPREREVLQLIAEGNTNKGIAHTLSISVKTVETHRGSIMRKLDVHETAGLVRYAIRRGLTSV
jgi:two-component system response regulator NreC